jgi:DNA-binding XRE family transcriptional regulator
MMSFRFAPDRRKRVTGRFFARVRRELQKAFMEEKKERGLTQSQLARELGVDRAVVCRQLSGTSNLTLRTLADYAWAMNRDLIFAMPKHDAGANHYMPVEPQVPGTIPATDVIPVFALHQKLGNASNGNDAAVAAA